MVQFVVQNPGVAERKGFVLDDDGGLSGDSGPKAMADGTTRDEDGAESEVVEDTEEEGTADEDIPGRLTAVQEGTRHVGQITKWSQKKGRGLIKTEDGIMVAFRGRDVNRPRRVRKGEQALFKAVYDKAAARWFVVSCQLVSPDAEDEATLTLPTLL